MENISVICGNRYAREYRSLSAEISQSVAYAHSQTTKYYI